MTKETKKRIATIVRWSVAVVGIWWVVSNMSLRDSATVLDPQTNLPQRTRLSSHAEDNAAQYHIINPQTRAYEIVPAERLINPIGKPKPVTLNLAGQEVAATIVGMRWQYNSEHTPIVSKLLVQPTGMSKGQWVDLNQVVGGYILDVPRPKVEVGLISMVQHANPWLLVLAVVVFPTTFVLTSYRWEKLLEAVGVTIGLWRVFVINMVGAFYNTFLPGSTGGDVFKALYAARQTKNRMAAVMSVVIDRILGLLALVMVGGVMAAYQYWKNPNRSDPTSAACFHVALACVAIIAGCGVALAVLFQPTVRTILGFEFVLKKLPMQKQVENARAVLRMYRARPVLVLWALLVTVPVHVTVITSALLAGEAFGLPIRPLFYFTAVPVIVLAGSIPISPQGAGVMEFFAVALTQRQGTTVSQAFALTMSIRVVQVLWNLTGGIFVLGGGFHAPNEADELEVEDDLADDSAPGGPAPTNSL